MFLGFVLCLIFNFPFSHLAITVCFVFKGNESRTALYSRGEAAYVG